MSRNHKPSCIILAGGRGRRMQNQDKGLVTIGHSTLIEHVIDCIHEDVDDIVISANRNIERYQAFSPRVVADEAAISQLGPLAGIASCLPHCKHDHVLITSCDIPLLPPDLVERLSAGIGNKDISVCETGRRLQAILLVHKHCLHSIENALQSGELSLIGWIRRQNYREVVFGDDDAGLLNINTIDDARLYSQQIES